MDNMEKQLLETPAFRGEASFLSNFSLYQKGEEMIVDGITYVSNEHWYQASKFVNRGEKMIIANHPLKGLKRKARELSGPRHPNWDTIKQLIMLQGLRHKFNQPRLKALLLSTKDYALVERNTWHDTYWGVHEGKGLNMLGAMLTLIRTELRLNQEENGR